MRSVLLAQFLKDKRNPLVILLLITGSIIATLLFAGANYAPTTVAVFSEEENGSDIEEKWIDLLNNDDSIIFEIVDSKQAREKVREGDTEVAVKLMENDYRLVIGSETTKVLYIQEYVDKIFQHEAQMNALVELTGEEDVRKQMEYYIARAPFQLDIQGLDSKQIPAYNIKTQLLFAFTFLISMFLLGLKVNNVTHDKVSGIWDRMILSPMKKTSMYSGYLLYSFLVTIVQIFIVLFLFKYVMDYDIGNNLLLIMLISAFFTFSMISVAMLITGIVRTPEQFYSIYPSLIPIIPLISGAYMMPGTITNSFLLFIADLFPLAHAMEAIMSVIFYNASFQDISMSLLYMLLIGIVAMGIGINLVERRSN